VAGIVGVGCSLGFGYANDSNWQGVKRKTSVSFSLDKPMDERLRWFCQEANATPARSHPRSDFGPKSQMQETSVFGDFGLPGASARFFLLDGKQGQEVD
jgi:hypothetical protein